MGPVFATVAWILAMIGVNKNPTAFFLLLATGVQAASVVASMSWCTEFWDCPWLFGSLSNVAAACLFFLSWLLAMCCLAKEQRKKENDTDDDEEEHHSTIAYGSASQAEDSSIFFAEEEDDLREDKQSAEDLLGTDDPIILRTVAQSALVARDIKSVLQNRKKREIMDEDCDLEKESELHP
jgi:hypothetical protein